MVGTVKQVEQATQVKTQVNAAFDLIAKALASSAAKQTGLDRLDTEAVITILEDKRTEVMAKTQASYFINNRRELNEVHELIAQDPAYQAIHSKRARRQR